MEKLLTVKDMCEYLQVSQALVHKWVHYGFIPNIKLGASIRVNKSEIESKVQKRQRKGRCSYQDLKGRRVLTILLGYGKLRMPTQWEHRIPLAPNPCGFGFFFNELDI